ncbi:hypothetical protein [Chengkuizengella marina]|uniref:Uncharacterized protein n=1 Tax=Chengkuizengella marina TaxID=2507566 RepID=A0A6N9PZV6_9BACL|nr:hypothetical protein [Chengkuizengella marina]NBI29041.1 hypothetical protein [Chengkuizengella marina]
MHSKNISAIEELIQLEERLLSITYVTPFKKAELARYFRLKGDYYIHTKRVEEGINFYLEAAKRYGKVDLIARESECLKFIMDLYTNNKEMIDVSTIEKLGNNLDYKVNTSE